MSVATSAYRFTRHADEYAVTTREGGGMLGIVRRTGKTWTARPVTAEQGAHLYVTEHHTRLNAAIALDAADLKATRATPVKTTAPVGTDAAPATVLTERRWSEGAPLTLTTHPNRFLAHVSIATDEHGTRLGQITPTARSFRAYRRWSAADDWRKVSHFRSVDAALAWISKGARSQDDANATARAVGL